MYLRAHAIITGCLRCRPVLCSTKTHVPNRVSAMGPMVTLHDTYFVLACTVTPAKGVVPGVTLYSIPLGACKRHIEVTPV